MFFKGGGGFHGTLGTPLDPPLNTAVTDITVELSDIGWENSMVSSLAACI